MRKGIFAVFLLLVMCASGLVAATPTFAATLPASSSSASATGKDHVGGRHAFWKPGYHPARTASATANAATAAPNLNYNGGSVMSSEANIYAIFWAPQGFPGGYVSLIEQYFNDVGGSALYQNNAQYTDSRGNFPSNSRLAGAWVDSGGYPEAPLIDADIQNEVSRAESANGWVTGPDNEFFVFTGQGTNICFDSSHSQCASNAFCAYHSSYGNGTIYATMPYAASFSCGTSRPNNNDADLTINVTSHEQMESATDPYPSSGWADASGSEIGDKCAWTFGPTNSNGADAVWNGHQYIVQQEWSNAINGCTMGRNASGPIHGPGGKCVDVNGANSTSGTVVQLYDCNNTVAQNWTLTTNGTLQALGKCLDIIGNGTAAGTKVQIWDCNGVGGQQWTPQANGSLFNPQSGMCLDDPGGNTANLTQLQIWNCNNLWPQVYQTPGRGTIGAIGAPGGKCVDVSGSNPTSGTSVQLWDCNGSGAQIWSAAPNGTLQALGKCLDIIGNGTAAGTKVQLWDCNGVGGQQWVPQSNGSVRNPQSGLCLDDPGGNTANGTQLQIWTCNNSSPQVYQLP